MGGVTYAKGEATRTLSSSSNKEVSGKQLWFDVFFFRPPLLDMTNVLPFSSQLRTLFVGAEYEKLIRRR
jgi:hypothetical protein